MKIRLKRELTLFDVVCITIGSVVGADVFIASGITAGLIGQFSILAWILAGVFAIIIAAVFARCTTILPRTGGPYAFAHKAFGEFPGFMTGWMLWLAEWGALAVFPVAFVKYLEFFISLNWWQEIAAKAFLTIFLIATNYFGIKAAGKANDALTIVKLGPLALLIFFGIGFFIFNPSVFILNYTPSIPFDFGNFSSALVLVFWAYVGFELASVPATEIKNPKKTIPHAIILGMAVVAFFYLLVNFVVYGSVNNSVLASASTPLIDAAENIFGMFGLPFLVLVLAAGALVSISGSDESGTIGTSRLGYAMAVDGLFPHSFAKLHPKYRTPYIAILVQNSTAFLASCIGGITGLISFSTFFMLSAYLLTTLSLAKLQKKTDKLVVASVLICFYMLFNIQFWPLIIGLALIIMGIPFYIWASPKVALTDVQKIIVSEEYKLGRAIHMQERFLAHLFMHGRDLHRHVKERIQRHKAK